MKSVIKKKYIKSIDDMNTQCAQCSKTFQIDSHDQEFYARINVPEPTLCPDCRMQRRLAWRNERIFYTATCAQCNRAIVSQFSPNTNLIVYCEKCYWSDTWSGQDYGRQFDFSRTFAEQFTELNQLVPHMAMIHTESENCEYTHLAANNKNCYMIIESSHNEDCSYCYWIQRSTQCVDTSFTDGGQLLYETDNATNCYRVHYSQNVRDCMDSYFLRNCRNVKNSFGCVNLNNKQYFIFNQQHTQTEYERYIAKAQLTTWSGIQTAKQKCAEFSLKQPYKYAEVFASENVTGNYLHHANRCQQVYHGYDIDSVSYSEHVWRTAKDVMDASTVGIEAELVYDSINCALSVYNIQFSNQCWHGCSDIAYSMYCGSLKRGFGCAAVKSGSNLILNMEYPVVEYDTLKARMIEHMKETGEWGKFLHPRYSPFGYNESVAYEQFPIQQAEALELKLNWQDQLPHTIGQETMTELPESIEETQDTIVQDVLACETCSRNYRMTSQELTLYRDLGVPIPHACPNCRHAARMQKRNPNHLWHRQCMCTQPGHDHGGIHSGSAKQCPREFETTYSPDRKEIVYCEQCYQKEIY